MNFKNYYNELKRRNVIKAALAYLVFAWIVIQVFSILLPTYDAPFYVMKIIIAVLIIGFFLWLIFSWVYEITPDGIKKTVNIQPDESITPQTSNRLNKIIIGGLGLVVVLLVITMFGNKTSTANDSKTARDGITSTDKSIAVLAFADMSPKKDQEYFSDGISEEILNLLAKIPNLKVISRTSSFSFRGKEVTTQEIGKTLHVNHILEGSVRKSGNTFRITTQLINVADGTHLWSETYDRSMDSIFKIQDEIAAAVTKQLKLTLLGAAITTKTVNPEAYTLYLQAKQVNGLLSSESNANAEQLIRQSLATDSTYAPSWALLSNIIGKSSNNFFKRAFLEGLTLGKPAALKAIALDADYALGYAELAYWDRVTWDFKAANISLQKSLQLAPENAEVIKAAASNFLSLGKVEDAIVLEKKAILLDPVNNLLHFNLALLYAWNKQYVEAENEMQMYLLLNPNSGFAHNFMAHILLGQGKNELALLEVEKDTDPMWSLYEKSMVVYALNNKKEANTLLEELISTYGNELWPNIAHVYAFRGEKDNAFKWLELAYENKDVSLLEILNYPEFESLWGDPRWNAFIDKLGLPDDHGFHLD
jgi:TolB-like protein